MKRKTIALLLAVSLIAMLAACGGGQATTTTAAPATTTEAPATTTEAPAATTKAPATTTTAPATEAAKETTEEKELYVIDILVEPSLITSSGDTELGKIIKDKFGIQFEYIQYAGNLPEKYNLMLAAGDYNEMQRMWRFDVINNYIGAGVMQCLDPYLPDMPNFTKRFADTIPYWRVESNMGGDLYLWEANALTRDVDAALTGNNAMCVRSDLLEKMGWPVPVSASEWIDFLAAAVPGAVDVNGIPIAGVTMPMGEYWGTGSVPIMFYETGDTYAQVVTTPHILNIKTQRLDDQFKAPPVKENFLFWSRLNRLGLFDEECFADTTTNTQEKSARGSVAAIRYAGWLANNAELIKSGHEEMLYVTLPIQADSQVATGQKRALKMQTTRPEDAFGITDKCKHPERIMELIDWFSTDEGQIFIRNGIEGKHWNRDASGKRVLTDEFKKCKNDPEYNKLVGIGFFPGQPFFNVRADDGQPHDLTQEISYIDSTLTDRAKEVFKNLGWDSSQTWNLKNCFLAETGLAGAVSIPPDTDLGQLATKMFDVRKKWTAPLMTAESDEAFESIWEEAMAEYEALHPEDYINELNRKLDESKGLLEEYKKR